LGREIVLAFWVVPILTEWVGAIFVFCVVAVIDSSTVMEVVARIVNDSISF